MNIILGTDWWTDCDDVLALRLICNMHKAKKINLCGIIINGCMDESAASVSGFMCAEGLGNIPIGLDKEATDFGIYRKEKYQTNLAKLPHNITNETAENPIKLYRKLLSESIDKIDVIEIGYPQVLAALLKSEADEYSDLNGIELVTQKVRKLWIMAGNYKNEVGNENNFARNARSREGGSYLCEN